MKQKRAKIFSGHRRGSGGMTNSESALGCLGGWGSGTVVAKYKCRYIQNTGSDKRADYYYQT